MMMSMFSSLDALFAESFGQRVGFSWSKDARSSSLLSENKGHLNNKLTENKKLPENQEAVRRNKTMSTRFAPELDGLHCFETIVPC